MKNSKKIIQIANFNITFDETNEVMLDRFDDVIYPAFKSDHIIGSKKNNNLEYCFRDVEISTFKEDYILTGFLIKNTIIQRNTEMINNKLTPSPLTVDTAPYSRFIIFLKNHRMLLIKNESSSPNIRSFQKSVREVISKYVFEHNNKKCNSDNKLPIANVNIVDIPIKENIDEAIEKMVKIERLKLRFFPLNNDVSTDEFIKSIYRKKQDLGSRNASLVFPSPKDKKAIEDMVKSAEGLAEPRIQGIDKNGKTVTLKDKTFNSKILYEYDDNITKQSDFMILNDFSDDYVLHRTSDDNASLYEKLKYKIAKLIKKDWYLWKI